MQYLGPQSKKISKSSILIKTKKDILKVHLFYEEKKEIAICRILSLIHNSNNTEIDTGK